VSLVDSDKNDPKQQIRNCSIFFDLATQLCQNASPNAPWSARARCEELIRWPEEEEVEKVHLPTLVAQVL